MPRPASKKKTAKSVVKNKNVRVGSSAEKALEKVSKQMNAQIGKLRIARDKLRQKRAAVAKKSTTASTAALDKAHALVSAHSTSIAEMRNSIRMTKAEVRIEAVLKKIHQVEEVAEQKLRQFEEKLAGQTNVDLKTALEKFEQRWLKQRELYNTRKKKLAATRSGAKIKAVEKKCKAEAAAILKRTNKITAKPVKSKGRPGRPAGAVSKTSKGSAKAGAASKQRGRPAKAVSKTTTRVTSSSPKRRGRPQKTLALVTKKTTKSASKKVNEPKKRGRPAKPKATATTTKRSPKKSKASVASAPKKRDRPKKVVKLK